MSDSTESGSSRDPLDPNRNAGPKPDRDLERDPDPATFRESGREPGYDPAPDVADGVDTPDTSGVDGGDAEVGSYVEGDYGDAGAVEEAPAAVDEEPGYTAGNYGSAGEAPGGVPASELSDERREDRTEDLTEELAGNEGEYQEGDYGKAGTSERMRIAEEGGDVTDGEYPEGDYGDAGTVGEPRGNGYPEDERP